MSDDRRVSDVRGLDRTQVTDQGGGQDTELPPPVLPLWVRVIAVVLAFLVVVVLIRVFFTVRICDTQLAQSGTAVEVCRHLQATDPPAALCALVVLILLGATVFSEVSAFGVTLRGAVVAIGRKQKVIETEVNKTATTANAAKENSEDLYEALNGQVARLQEEVLELHRRMESGSRTTDGPLVEAGAGRDSVGREAMDSVGDLEARYDEIRRTMPSGPNRTAAMDNVFQQMIAVLRDASSFDILGHLRSSGRSQRLSGYAFLQAMPPEPSIVPELVRALLAEDKPYGEYQAGKALLRIAEAHPEVLTPEVRDLLAARLRNLPHGSDRAQLLQRVLRLGRP